MATEEAWKALRYARQEYGRYQREGDRLILRDAAERAWLAAVLATDALIIGRGLKKPESCKERKDLLRELSLREERVKQLGIWDRFAARAYSSTYLDSMRGT